MKYFKSMLWMGVLTLSSFVSAAPVDVDTVSSESGKDKWVGGWGRALVRARVAEEITPALAPIYQNGLTNHTIRQIAHMTTSGKKVRLRFQNQFQKSDTSRASYTIAEVRIAKQTTAQEIKTSTDTLVTFNNGQTSVEVAPGGEVISDGVDFDVEAGENIAVSIYFSSPSGPPPAQYTNLVSVYLPAAAGNLTSAATFALDPSSATIQGQVWFKGVDVYKNKNRGTILIFGDSIVTGTNSTRDGFNDFTSELADRINASHRTKEKWGILNEGIPGNQITNGGSFAAVVPVVQFGASALERMNADIFNQTNVKYVIWLEGINDITFGGKTADQIINGTSQAIAQIKATWPDVEVFGGTLTPYKGNTLIPWTQAGEDIRQAVNQWIRTDADFDEVIDFDKVLRTPGNPEFMQAALTSDGLHPNDAGYKAMAGAVDLDLFRD